MRVIISNNRILSAVLDTNRDGEVQRWVWYLFFFFVVPLFVFKTLALGQIGISKGNEVYQSKMAKVVLILN